MPKPIELLTRAELHRAMEKAHAAWSALIDEMIAAGRGHEMPTVTRTKSDDLSKRFIAALDHDSSLRAELRHRMEFHGKATPIRRQVA